SVGDVVRVWVKEIEKERRRVSLTMVAPGTERAKPERRERTDQKPQGGEHGPRRRHDRGRRPPQYTPTGQPIQQGTPVEGAAVAATVEGQPAAQTSRPPKKPYGGGGARTGGGKPPYK